MNGNMCPKENFLRAEKGYTSEIELLLTVIPRLHTWRNSLGESYNRSCLYTNILLTYLHY